MIHSASVLRPPHRPEGSPRFAICGLGLMGGSLAYALRHFIPSCQVTGVERDPRRLAEARTLEVAHDYREDASQLDASAYDVVFVASPVSVAAPVVLALAEAASGGALISDLGSVKGRVYAQLEGKLPAGIQFIGGHPMTGSQLEGLEGADPHLYENAVYILTPCNQADDDALQALESVLEALGCLVQKMNPEVHDHAVSTISHLPYLLACGLVEVLQTVHGDSGGRAAPIAAGSFHGATRVAACPPHVFRDILQSNRVALRDDARILIERLEGLLEALEEEGGAELEARFAAAQAFRRRLPTLRKGVLPQLPEAIIKAQDKPGFIGQVASLIGAAHINIRDIEVLHSREGEGGTLRVAFEDRESRLKALRILEIAGYAAAERDG